MSKNDSIIFETVLKIVLLLPLSVCQILGTIKNKKVHTRTNIEFSQVYKVHIVRRVFPCSTSIIIPLLSPRSRSNLDTV